MIIVNNSNNSDDINLLKLFKNKSSSDKYK